MPISLLGDADRPLTPVRWFVDELGTDLGLSLRPVDQRRRRVLYLLARWATSEGLPLDREAILDPGIVERFCQVALSNDNSRATLRSDLRHMGRRLTKTAPWEPRPRPMARRDVALPYTQTEVALFKSDAQNQPTAVRRRGARALLALGLGVGLDGRWVARVESNDVRAHDGVVEVRVGPPAPRSVVVLADGEDDVLELARTAGGGCLLGRRSQARNRVGDLAKSLVCPAGHPRVSPGRLRSTWLLWHLEAGTRLPELCRAAGLQGFTVLSDLMAFVEPFDGGGERAHLRGLDR